MKKGLIVIIGLFSTMGILTIARSEVPSNDETRVIEGALR